MRRIMPRLTEAAAVRAGRQITPRIGRVPFAIGETNNLHRTVARRERTSTPPTSTTGRTDMRVNRRLPIMRLGLAATAATVLALLLLPAGAGAFTVPFPAGSPFTGATAVITNFPHCNPSPPIAESGPLGLSNNGSQIFVIDGCNQTTYRFPLAGGSALAPEASFKAGLDIGLGLSDGTYFGVNQIGRGGIASGLYSFDPVTLELDAGQPPPLVGELTWPGQHDGVVADPLSTDLYVSGEKGIYRIEDPTTEPIVTLVAKGEYDGLDFNEDGSRLYAANPTHNEVVAFARVGEAIGGPPVLELSIPHKPDGIAVAPTNATSHGLDLSDNVFVNSNDGTIERIDVNHANAVSVIAEKGTRGDFATIGPEHCLYVTQTSTIEKMIPCLSEPPEFGRCLKVAAGKGRFASAACTKESTKGNYEWDPAFGGAGPLVKTHFTFADVTSTPKPSLETANKTKITCTGQSGTGEYTGTKTVGSATMTFTGCESLSHKCSTGATEGEIVTETLRGELGIITKGAEPAKNTIGLDLEPSSGDVFAEFSCGSTSFEVRGSVIVKVATNKMTTTQKLKYSAVKSAQKPTHFENDTDDVLETSITSKPFEATGLILPTEQTSEEKVEINSVV
jgi:hypothetical protein